MELIPVPLPPLATQKRIADILDTADALRRKDQELLTKYDQLAQAIFIDMFGDPVKNEKGWEVKKLGEVLDVDAKGVDPSNLLSYNYIGLEHIEKQTGKILEIDKGEVVSNKFIFSSEHILYGKLRPYLNKVATPNFSGICSTDIFPLKPKNALYKSFIVFILRSQDFVNHSNTNAVGANLPRANKDVIINYKTIFPNEKTIIDFSKRVEVVNILKSKLEKQISDSTSLFSSLIQQTFNGTLVS
jgi:type I restriction enzyme S subunit